jgi:hypothetical protein
MSVAAVTVAVAADVAAVERHGAMRILLLCFSFIDGSLYPNTNEYSKESVMSS